MADEKKFPLEQDPQAYALDMMRKDGAVLAIKASPVLVRKAMPGEMIRTYSQDGVETVNSAGEDSFVLTKADRSTGKPVIDGNGHDNSWIIEGDAFREAYRLGPDFNGEGLVDPIADLRTLVRVDKDMSVMASWGEEQSVSKGGYLNITDPNNIYAVSERDFDDTHVDAPMAAKFIDPDDDNPFWVQTADLAHQLDVAKDADEDTYDEACRQADALGTASLTEDQQIMVDVMGRQGLEQAWQFLDDTGFDSGKPSHEVDTGRYLQIRFIGSNTPPMDVYESVPQTIDGKVQHEFWDVTRDYHGRMSMPESDFEILGVYDGKPFQLARDAIAKEIGELEAQKQAAMQAKGQSFDRQQLSEQSPAVKAMFAHVEAQNAGATPDGPAGPEVPTV